MFRSMKGKSGMQHPGRRDERPEAFRVRLLGGFWVSVGPRLIEEDEWRLKKAAALVKLLALAPGHRIHREQVADLLWPGLDRRAAANNLYYTLHHARRVLEPETTSYHLRLVEGQLALYPEGLVWVDTEAFEEAAKAARRSHDPAAYRAAMELYAGDLLPRDRYESWIEERRAELRALHLALIVEMARLRKERGEREAAIEALVRVAAIEPTHEEARAELMRLCAASGRRGEALSHYERLEEVLAKDLGEEPSTASKRLYEEIKAGRALEIPPLARPLPDESSGARHNLPAARTSFIGREREIVEIKRALATTRLLTLTGAGGSGKTRLALEVAKDLVPLYPDGTWLVELAPLSERTLVPQAFAGILGVREKPGHSLTETLVDHLRTKNLLLVADNCEHLAEEAAALLDVLLDVCPRLSILATSREALRVAGEAVYPVRPLSVPDADRSPGLDDLTEYESVRLFAKRARQRLPTFSLTPENARSVADICRGLDGIPLAIELATARMTTLAVDQLAERMDDSLKLLTVGNRTAEPRQRTLKAALDWSYDPLSEKEKKLFGRLSVFAGGWTLRAAEAVGAGDGIGEDEVLDLLSRLVDKSLVVVGSRDTLRYGMLEPVRQYARKKLKESGEAKRALRRHAEFFLTLAEEAEPELLGAQPAPWLERLELEHDNLRSALSWALDDSKEHAELGLRTATALAQFWGVYAVSEGRGWLEKGLARSGVSPLVRAKALNQAGWIALFQGDQDKAIAMLEEGRSLFEALGDKSGVATALANLGFALAHRGESERVTALREEARTLLGEPLDRRTRAHLLNFLALAALDADDFEQATVLAGRSLTLYRELGDAQGIGISLTALAMTTLGAREPERARGFFEESLRVLREMGHKMGIAYCLLGLGGVAGEQLRPERAARLWGAAEALREAIGMDLSPFDRAHSRYEERLSAARSLTDNKVWEAAWSEGRAMNPEEAIEYALSKEDAIRAPESQSPVEQSEALTPREREVAGHVARGLTNHQIAAELSISERTVHTHVRRILRKLELRSRAQIAAWVIENRSPRESG